MTLYKLPPLLGGGEIDAEEIWGGCAGGQPEYRLAGSEIVILAPRGTPFEPVTPPLPPEPPPGYYLVQEAPAVAGFLAEHEEGYGWHVARSGVGLMWTDMCGLWPDAVFTRLVPALEPVGLPWSAMDRAVEVDAAVGCGCHGEEDGARLIRVAMDTPKHFEPAEAREFGRALMTAANATDEAQP